MPGKVDLRPECASKQPWLGSLAFAEIPPGRRRLNRLLPQAGSILLTLLLTIPIDVHAARQARNKHSVTLNDLRSLKTGTLTALAPDGRTLAYAVDEEIWLISTRPGSAPQKVGSGHLPVWSPGSDRLAYYSSQSGTLQLWVLDIKANRAEQATNFVEGIDPDPWTRMIGYFHDAFRYSWSPDGRRMAFASRVPASGGNSAARQNDSTKPAPSPQMGAPLVLTATTPPEWTLRGIFTHGFGAGAWSNGKVSYESDPNSGSPSTKVNQLFLADINAKTVRQLTTDDFGYFHPDWSPDGKKIVCASNEGKSLQGGSSGTTNVYSINVATGEKVAITHERGDKFMPSWSPDGMWIAYRGGEHFGIEHVFVVPAAGGTPRVLSPRDRYIQEHQWAGDSKSVIVMYRDGVTDSIAQIDRGTDVVKILNGPEAAVRNLLTVSRSGSVSWQESSPSTLGVLRVLPAGAGTSQVLVDLNPQIQQWELGEQEVLRWRNHRGDEMEGVLLKPADYRNGHRFPLIVDAYPMQRNSLKGVMSGNQAWASRGYVVFWPNARAPHVWMNPFKSEAYSRAAKGPSGWDITFDDVMSGIDELIRRGIVDPDRMGLYGFSNGGGIVNDLVTKTNRFRCAVSVAGAVSDWLRPALLETDSKFPDFEGGTNPWKDPEPYIKLSPIFRLENVTTPMLLADGDNDGTFLLNTIEMYNGLRRLGKDVTFLRYADQDHGFTGAALEDFWNRENAFFDRYLKGAGL